MVFEWTIALLVGGIVIAVFLGVAKFSSSTKTPTEQDVPSATVETKVEGEVKSGLVKEKPPKQVKVKVEKSNTKTEFTHPWLATVLKGPADQITSFDISNNGRFLASTAQDRSMFIWCVKDILGKDNRSVRANVEYDCARLVKFCPDNKSLITCLENGNNIRALKFTKNEDGSVGKILPAAVDFVKTHDEEVIGIGIDSVGNYVMTADKGTNIDILSIKGEKLARLETGTMKNAEACVSPCGRFVAVCGFTPDVKVWEISFDKSRAFKGTKRAFDLKGHKAGILSFAFSADSGRMATVSKDGTWRLWRTDVDYIRGQDPSTLASGPFTTTSEYTKVSLSPDGKTIAISSGNNVTFINTVTCESDAVIPSLFNSNIRHLMFSVDGSYLFCCGDRNIKAFHNVTGYRSKIADLTNQLKNCSKNMERRLTDQLNEARCALESLGIK